MPGSTCFAKATQGKPGEPRSGAPRGPASPSSLPRTQRKGPAGTFGARAPTSPGGAPRLRPRRKPRDGHEAGSMKGKIHSPRSIRSRHRAGARTTRKPRLLFAFDGLFLLRFADRQFEASLFQLPPRFTRFEPTAPCPSPESDDGKRVYHLLSRKQARDRHV